MWPATTAGGKPFWRSTILCVLLLGLAARRWPNRGDRAPRARVGPSWHPDSRWSFLEIQRRAAAFLIPRLYPGGSLGLDGRLHGPLPLTGELARLSPPREYERCSRSSSATRGAARLHRTDRAGHPLRDRAGRPAGRRAVIFPAVFSVGIAPSGPSLVFITLPGIFNGMPLIMVWSVGVLPAAHRGGLTSTISLYEVVADYLHEERHLSRACGPPPFRPGR